MYFFFANFKLVYLANVLCVAYMQNWIKEAWVRSGKRGGEVGRWVDEKEEPG